MVELKPEWKNLIKSVDVQRDIIIPGDQPAALKFCVEHFISIAHDSITDHGYFAVALSGGSTPKAIFQLLAQAPYRNQVDWQKVRLFWSDERCVPLDHPDSNYHMAMQSGFATLPIPKEHIFPMITEGDLEQNAVAYEKLVQKYANGIFDLVMLGMGEDGHTASLFPKTHGLHPTHRLVIANFIPEKDVWRMSLTYECINAARNIAIYLLGKSKAKMVKQVLTGKYEPDILPVQAIGTPTHKALWVLDKDAAAELN